MNMNDNSLFLTKIEYYYNLQTNLTSCIDNIIELVVNYFKEF